MMQAPVDLAPAGAGLPKTEAYLLRKVAFPLLRIKLSRGSCLDLFRRSGEEISEMVAPLNLEQFTQPVLIKRMPGLEDSSRYWSAEMTLEHIQIVSAGALYIIKKLEANQPIDLPVRTQDVKPTGGLALDRKRSFNDYLEEIPHKLEPLTLKGNATHLHPWFGELKAMDWLRLLSFHQDLHRKQVRAIIRGLT
ncbi:MAG: hypothetical protein Q7Q71_06600 [Verrucomicrobiota bacterium JB023]|nr:hypothetical protein [Verrucomicrobiota bacterium JB023]